ncbi:DUF2799 domain-containing protein [Vibrio gallicus]|uniref:DUF2799 domain-containing protein n=1 Tax=Vibrio gallicus TaxID=190897 RepID=UPI0021C2D28A|nr:DUF2799 domain-containing protein [Vibrio gallicus]
MKSLNLGILVISAAMLIGCASSETDLIAKGDWNAIGYRDGVKGSLPRTYSRLKELGEANIGAYEQGYSRGVAEYCNPNFAYQMGLTGHYYEGACEGREDAQKFRMEWQRGWNERN